MTDSSGERSGRHLKRSSNRRVMWAVSVLVLCAVAIGAWVGVRATLARAELTALVSVARNITEQPSDQRDPDIKATVETIEAHANAAATLTSDPIWRAVELVPFVGQNFTAVREMAGIVRDISNHAVVPLGEAVESFKLADFQPLDGALDVQPLLEARDPAERAAKAVAAAQDRLRDVETGSTFAEVDAAKVQLETQLARIAGPVNALRSATRLIPDMLGASGEREYLLLFQNPAELRASGGISGAVALIRANAGKIELVAQASSSDFPEYAQPVLPLSDDVRSLYGDKTGRYIQNVNLTPDYTVSAPLAREMWKRTFGAEVDGVFSIDPVALSYVLAATGPVSVATGDVLTAENAVEMLLRDAYLRYDDPAQQDVFFAAAASAVFDKVAAGNLDPVGLFGALTKAGLERRVRVWSAIEVEQAEILETTLAGALPAKSRDEQPFGVYLNDATASKMDFYLDVQVANGQVTCREDDRPNYGVAVTLTNTAPLDARETLPDYVTGAGSFGVAPGNIKTLLNVYGSPELQNLGVSRDGAVVPYLPTRDSGYQVSQLAIELAPGESTTILFGFLGASAFVGEILTEQTPVINRHETKNIALTCDSPLW